jgi:hypothetical protein
MDRVHAVKPLPKPKPNETLIAIVADEGMWVEYREGGPAGEVVYAHWVSDLVYFGSHKTPTRR